MLLPFDRAGKSAHLVELLNTVDSKALPPGSSVARLMESPPTDPKTNEQVKTLYRRHWAAFPGHHHSLVSTVVRPEIWQMPEMFDYTCDGILPEARAGLVSAVYYHSPFVSRTQRGRERSPGIPGSIAPAVLRLIDLAEERVGWISSWKDRDGDGEGAGGTVADAIKAMVLCRTGRLSEARSVGAGDRVVQKQEFGIAPYKILIDWAASAELGRYPATRGLALTAFEASLLDPYAVLQFSLLRAARMGSCSRDRAACRANRPAGRSSPGMLGCVPQQFRRFPVIPKRPIGPRVWSVST